MVVSSYVPDRGDVVWINLDPVSGHEQGGRRPAYVLTPKIYNQKIRLMLVCPITKKCKGYPGEIPVSGKKITGFLLVDHVQSKDWSHRDVSFIENIGNEIHGEVVRFLTLLIS